MASSTDTERPALVLFRHDLRVSDNKALSAAASSGKPVVAAFVFDEQSPGVRLIGGARRWWLHHSLAALSKRLDGLGLPLVLRRGPMKDVAEDICRSTGADTVFWNRRYDPPGVAADTAMKSALVERGIAAESFDGHLLHQPWEIRTGAGKPYRVYTPFWRALRKSIDPRDPVDAPHGMRSPGARIKIESEELSDWNLLPHSPDWAGGLRDEWTPGEDGGKARLKAFLNTTVDDYAGGRDRPGEEGTSRLSPHLAHGEITPFQVWHAARGHKGHGDGPETFLKEIAWREFCWHLLFHNPDLGHANFDRDFDAFEWRDARKFQRAWEKGETGYPVVDAGMRQLWQTGWMHNRVRMITASFLIKDLLIDWRHGEKWFWDTLVDADPASNAANWQWVAGSGADAAPFFRIFNPVLQGRKFDPQGDYVSRFVPELARLPAKQIHEPSKAGEATLDAAAVKLGTTYPVPAVDHGEARDSALAQFRRIKGKA